MKKVIKDRYYADFETTKENENNETRVYLWAICKGEYTKHGETLESFMEEISTLKDAIIYFHNLGGWDFNFIHYYLLENDISYSICQKYNKIYSVKIKFEENEICLWDSLNFLPFSLKEIGESFNEKYKKTCIDYETPYNHLATEQEIEYCINDVKVLEEGMENFYHLVLSIFKENHWKDSYMNIFNKQTISGIAFNAFCESSNYYKCCRNLTVDDSFLRNAYYGGYVYSNDLGVVEDVQMIDDNSMYPYTYGYTPLPFGDGIKLQDEEDLEDFDFYVLNCNILFKLKDGYPPIIPGSRNMYSSDIYMKDSGNEYLNMTFTSTDLERIKKYYDCDIEFVKAYGFYTSDSFYRKYADALIKLKSESKGAKRIVVKLLLNSPYGKLALFPSTEELCYHIENGKIQKDIISHGFNEKDLNYLPQALAITANARKILFDRCELVKWKNVMYTDTDSVKYINKENIKFDLNDYELGAWKDEGNCKYFKTISPKRYGYYIKEEEKGYIAFTCSGFGKNEVVEEIALKSGIKQEYINDNLIDNKLYCSEKDAKKMLDNFKLGLEISVLQKRKTKNGVVLDKIKKEMRKK